MGCASSSRAVSGSARLDAEKPEFEAILAMQVDPWAMPQSLAVDDDTRVPVELYLRLCREGARCRAASGSHVPIFDARGSQRLRRPLRRSLSQASAFTRGEAVHVLGYISRFEALGSAVVGSVQSVCAVAEDGRRYRLSGLGDRWFEEVELEACEKATADSHASTAASSTSSNLTSVAQSECSSEDMIEISVL